MATGNRKVDIYLKKFLTQQQITENFFDFLEQKIHDVFTKLFPVNGVFEPNILLSNILSASAPDSFDISSPLRGTDGAQGNYLILDPIDANLISFENAFSIPYYVGLRFNYLPRETEINVRTGEIKYTFKEESVGEVADPNSVNDDGDETLTLIIDSVCEPGVSHAGRKAVVWLKRAQNQAQAFEELTVIWDGVNNKIETLTALGQTLGNISTDPSDYQVFLKGPTIRRNTDLRLDNNILFLGIITGAGPGNTPSSFDETDVNNHAVSFPSLVSLFFEEHSSVDGTHTLITPERITTKQIIPGVQLDTQVNASDEDSPDIPVSHTLFSSSGGSGIQGIKWRLRNAMGNPIAFIDAHGNAYFQSIAAVSSVFQSSVVVEGDQNIKGSTTLGDNINVDKVTFNSVLQSLTDMLYVIDSDNNGVGHAHKFYNHSVAALNEIFRINESGLIRLFGNIETANTGLGIDLDADNVGIGELFQITKNGGLTPLLQLLETGRLRLFDKIITPTASFGIDLDNDADATGESFAFTKNNFAQTLWLLNEFGDALSTRDTLTGLATAYKKADTTPISANSSLNETHDETIFRKLLKVTPNNPNNKAINIAPSRITGADGSDFVLPTGVLVSNYGGGTANFQTGAQAGGGLGFTPINFAGQANQWAKYSLNLLADNTILVLAATGFGATKATAPNPPLARGSIAFTVIAVQDNGSAGIGTINNISESNIDRIPAAGGSGSGSGDANSFFEDLKSRLEDGFFEWVTPNIFSLHEDDRIDPSSTATFDIANSRYNFGTLPPFTPIQQLVQTGANVIDVTRNSQEAAQTFTVPVAFKLTSITFDMRQVGSPTGMYRVRIYPTIAGAPDTSGAPLVISDPIDLSTLPTALGGGPPFTTFNFNQELLMPGVYAMVFLDDDMTGGSPGQIQIDGSGSSVYAGGNVFSFAVPGGPWTNQNRDIYFDIQGISLFRFLLSLQHYGARFLSSSRDNNQVELHSQWSTYDPLATYEVSQDGGVNWTAFVPDRIGESKKVRGILNLPDPTVLTSLVTYPVANADFNHTLNATTDQQLAYSFIVPPGEKWRGIQLTQYFHKLGSLTQGSLFPKVVKDSSGLPSSNAADLLSIGPVLSIPNMASIGILAQQPVFTAGQSFSASGSFQHWAQKFTLSQQTLVTSIQVKMTKIGSINLGNFTISLVKDNGSGKPSTNPIDYLVTSAPNPVAPILVAPASSDYTLNVNQTVIAGTYHIVFETDATYKANTSLFNAISVRRDSSIATNVHQEWNGSIWSDASPGQLYFVVNGSAANVDQLINFTSLLPSGTYWIVFETDAAYKAIFSAGVTELRLRTDTSAPTYAGAFAKFNGTIWSLVAGEDATFLLQGIKFDLRVRITAGTPNVSLEGYGVFYGETGPNVSTDDRAIQTFYFSGNIDQTIFTITNFLPDPSFLKIYDVNSGQVYRYPAFAVDGHKIVFAAGTFLNPGENITLIADQSEGAGFDNSDFNASLLAANHLGSADATIDRSLAGRGILLRRPDGTLREITLDDSDNIVVVSVP